MMNPVPETFKIAFLLSVGCLVAWYLVPEIDTLWVQAIALSTSGLGLLSFTRYYVQLFQRHLDV
jgi:membrane protein implicated in regulation of membrane protease activity